MKYLKSEDQTVIIKWNEETGLATIMNLKLTEDGEATTGLNIDTEVHFTEAEAKDYTEIDADTYMEIHDGKMEDYWLETAI